MYLKDAKPGDVIYIYVSKLGNNFNLSITKGGSSDIIKAYVLQQSIGTVLGWKAGDLHPAPHPYYDMDLTETWEASGIVFAQAYNDMCECEPFQTDSSTVSRPSYINECPCGIHPSKCDYHKL